MNLSIVIVNWNSREDLKRCLASVLKYTRDISFEIVVIDSGSFDGCDRMLSEHYPQVRFVQSAANLGFAKANNRAFEETTGETVLFLNPDTEVVASAVGTLYLALHSLPNAGLVGGKLLNSDGTLQSSCVLSMPTLANQLLNSEFLRTRWPKSRLWGMAPLFAEGSHAREVEAISGACLMVRRATFEKVGRFSEDYFMYAEDVDLAYKVRSAGCVNYYVPDATVMHHGGNSSAQASSTFAAVMIPEATWRFFRKTRGAAYSFGYRSVVFGSALGRLALIALSQSVSRASGRGNERNGSWRKWLAILRWSLKRNELVNKYYGADQAPSLVR